MHQFEFLVRDFYNAEKLCSKNSLIIMHDCLPLNEEMAHRDIITSVEIGKNSKFPNYWTGDVWKIIPILKNTAPIFVLNTWTALPQVSSLFTIWIAHRQYYVTHIMRF